MQSVYRIIATTEGKRNGLLQLKRLCRLLREQNIAYRVKEKVIPVEDWQDVTALHPRWYHRKFLSKEYPYTYFEVTFNCTKNSLSETVDGGSPPP